MFSALRAARRASAHFLAPLVAYTFLACAEAFFDTILPVLFLINMALVMPLWVFSFVPWNTLVRARLPLAMTLTLLAFFMRRMDFMLRMAFMLRIAFIAFFIARAMLDKRLRYRKH